MLKFISGLTRIRSVRIKLAKLSWIYQEDLYLQRKQSKTFEEATDEAIDALKKQITKYKQKKRGV